MLSFERYKVFHGESVVWLKFLYFKKYLTEKGPTTFRFEGRVNFLTKEREMKAMIFTAAMVVSSASLGQNAIEKQCSASVYYSNFDEPVEATIKLIKNGYRYSAIISEALDGEMLITYTESLVRSDEADVRAGLTAQSYRINALEQHIQRAMILSEDPNFEGACSVGFDLKKIRSARWYEIGNKNLNQKIVVEARDENNQVLGSFLVGETYVSPCK